ncbi:MAG TPA: hypothetical protein PKD70_13605 [Saprospiraceae bacterium]|nr:hypothetical protein [Saprospiraceae bacterium]HMP14910.1 hypothetical protein [Saprospiraceae bacterium]
MITRFIIITYASLFLPVFGVYGFAKSASNDQERLGSIFQTIAHQEVVDISIHADLAQLIDNRRSEAYLDATFTHYDAQGAKINYDVKVQTRGKFRRRVCDFPPIKLKFAKKNLDAAGLARDFNDLKLVTHCLDDREAGNENVLKEYLIYKLYNQLNPNSLRAQLVRVTYVDTQGKIGKTKRYGILLENTDEMAARLGGSEYEVMNVAPDSISKTDEMTTALFQYMIANADWDLRMLRNVKLVLHAGTGKVIPVPYDFDFAGLVNTSYALPQTDKGLYSIRDRLYLGNSFEQTSMRHTLAYFMTQKEHLLHTIKQMKLLSAASRTDMMRYVESFYNSIEPAYANTDIDLTAFFSLKNASVEALYEQQMYGLQAKGRK